MTRPDIQTIINNQDFAVLYRWEVIIPALPSAIANAGNYSSDNLNARAVSAEYPTYSNDEIEVGIHGHKVYQAGTITYNPITLTFVESENGIIERFIRDWGALLWKPGAGTQNKKREYVCPTIILRPLGSNNEKIHEYTLKNCWMQSHTIGSPAGDANQVIQPEVTLRFDYMLQDGQKV